MTHTLSPRAVEPRDARDSMDTTSLRPTIYDFTRLATRFLNDTPNGIDRVDLRLARHFAFKRADDTQALLWTIAGGPRLFPASLAQDLVLEIEEHWQELGAAGADHEDPLYEEVVQRLIRPGSGHGPITKASSRPRKRFSEALWKYGLRLGKSPTRAAPQGAAYLNATHFPLEYSSHLRWLQRRPDIVPAFFIHDLFPIVAPQYFWPAEPGRHARRMEHIAVLEGRIIVASSFVAEQVRRHFERDGRSARIVVARLPVSDAFLSPRRPNPRLAGRPYFVVCGTIERRKNHDFLLRLWREMAESSDDVPALVIVGKRGWNAEAAIDMLERASAISRHVIEVSGLSTSGLKRLMDNAAALLAPSISEGFGLPVAEALAAGVPVIAARIPSFGELAEDELVDQNLSLLDTLDGLGWLRTIRVLKGRSQNRTSQLTERSAFESSIERLLAG